MKNRLKRRKMDMKDITMIKQILKTGVICFGFFMLTSCQKKQELTAEYILQKSIEAHGGKEKWNSLEAIEFDKKTTLFLEDGSIEKTTDQHQYFTLRPEVKGSIQDLTFDGMSRFDYKNNAIWVVENDSVRPVNDPAELMRLTNSFFAAFHVACKPFDLMNENTLLTYSGEMEIDGKSCHIIDVSYATDGPDADKWSYMIDAETYEVVANKVVLTDHTSWVENLTFDTSTDFKFNAHRKSYRLNSDGEKTYLRAEYFYSNYKVTYQ